MSLVETLISNREKSSLYVDNALNHFNDHFAHDFQMRLKIKLYLTGNPNSAKCFLQLTDEEAMILINEIIASKETMLGN